MEALRDEDEMAVVYTPDPAQRHVVEALVIVGKAGGQKPGITEKFARCRPGAGRLVESELTKLGATVPSGPVWGALSRDWADKRARSIVKVSRV